MADSTKDTVDGIIKSDPTAALQAASKISLQGGGVLLFAALGAIYKLNDEPKWQIDNWLIFSLLVGAVLLGIAGTAARMYDAKLRVQFAAKILDAKGTIKEANDVIVGDSIVHVLADSLPRDGQPLTITVRREV